MNDLTPSNCKCLGAEGFEFGAAKEEAGSTIVSGLLLLCSLALLLPVFCSLMAGV